jgi:DNA-directed RNA polymerase subunit RPC12/RpoP
MASPAAEPNDSLVCPHCRKEFEGELLVASGTAGARGYKCPHCRLFVPLERANPGAS